MALEMQKLQKDHGFNPLMGCLPILAQVPVFLGLFHVLRSFNRTMPEEVNRVLTDHVSALLFCPTETAIANLRNEGIVKGVHDIGDVMYDAVLFAAAWRPIFSRPTR